MEELAVGQRTLGYADGERVRERERERECVFVCVYYPPADGMRGKPGVAGRDSGWLVMHLHKYITRTRTMLVLCCQFYPRSEAILSYAGMP